MFIGKEAPKKTIGIKYSYSTSDLITPGPGHYKQSNPNAGTGAEGTASNQIQIIIYIKMQIQKLVKKRELQI